MEDYKNLDELIKKTEEALIAMDPNTDDYDKTVETLAKLRGLKPKPEVKKSWKDYIKDMAQPIAMVFCGLLAAGVGVYQTKKVSDIEDEEQLVGERTHTDHSADAFHKDFLGCMLALFCVVPHYFQWFLTYTFHV